MEINKSLKVPLHHQVYLQIKVAIENKKWEAGEKLPSEKELEEIFDVSRITVRTAIEELEKDEYVKKKQGIGTIVLPIKYKYDLRELTSFSSDIEKVGGVSRSLIRRFEVIKADSKVSSALMIDPDNEVYYLERLRMSNEKIVGLHKAYILKGNLFSLNSSEISQTTSLYKLLSEKGIQLRHAEEVLKAKIPTKEQIEILQMNGDEAIFYKERISYSSIDVPVEYVEMYYNADIYTYKVSMEIENRE